MISKQKLINKLYGEADKLYAEGNKLRAEANKLYAEGDKLRAEGDKLCAEGDKLCAEGDKLYAEGDKLHAEGNKLRAESNKLFAEGDILEKMSKWDWICIWIQGYLWGMFHPFATHKQDEDRANQAAAKFMERKFGKNWRKKLENPDRV